MTRNQGTDMHGIRSIPHSADPHLMDTLARAFPVAAAGRKGDTMLAHLSPEKAAMLKRMGGAGTVNPKTGLREYHTGGDNGPGEGDESGNAGVGGGGPSGTGGGGGNDGPSFGGPGPADLSGTEPSFAGPSTGPGPVGLGGPDAGQTGVTGTEFGNPGGHDNTFGTLGAYSQEMNSVGKYGRNYKDLDTLQQIDVDLTSFLGRNSKSIEDAFVNSLASKAFGPLSGLVGLASMIGYGPTTWGGPAPEDAPTRGYSGTTGLGFSQEHGFAGTDQASQAEGGSRDEQVAPPAQVGAEGKDDGKAVDEKATLRYLPAEWDEEGYLAANPDVAEAVKLGIWRSGYDYDRASQKSPGGILSVRTGQAVFPGGSR